MTNYETFQVFIDGQPVKKFFKAMTHQSLWSRYNGWAKKQGGVMVEGDNYLGNMAWRIPRGIAEVRIVSVTTDNKTHLY